jgi:hypothetical protein
MWCIDKTVRRVLLIFVFAFVCFCNAALAQITMPGDTSLNPGQPMVQNHYEIKGIIKDKQTGDVVAYATLVFVHTTIGALANEKGAYVIGYDAIEGDSLRINAIGYKQIDTIIKHSELPQVINFTLTPEGKLLNEVIIHAGEDPVVLFMRKVIAHKKYNDPDRFINYKYETYSKIEVDLLNMTKERFEQLPIPYIKHFGYIYNNLDTTTGPEPFLPFFLIETLSDYYYQRSPKTTREYIKANQIRGVNNKSIMKYMGSMYLSVNPYDNFWLLFDKKFVSPLSDAGLAFYKYRFTDTLDINGKRAVKLSFRPLREGESCLTGEMNIIDTTFALEYIDGAIPKEANINWVKGASLYKQFSLLGDSTWFVTKENLTTELVAGKILPQVPGLIARRTLSYKYISINNPAVTDTLKKIGPEVVVADNARNVEDTFWQPLRHDVLTKNEAAIYYMFDTLEHDPVYRKFRNVVTFLTSGVKEVGPLELGPYWSLYSRNQIEGNRFRFSMGTTPKLFKDIYLNGYIAYGTRDERLKYNVGGFWILNRSPRMYVFASRTHDIDRTVTYYDNVSFDNIFSVAVRRKGIPRKLVFADEYRFDFYKEYLSGFSHMLSFVHRLSDPYNPLPSDKIYHNEEGTPTGVLNNTEVAVKLRYAHKERFVEGNYYRVSLGSKLPIVDLKLSAGLKGVFHSSYEYKKLAITVSDGIRIAPLGELYINAFAGKVYGTLPYNLLEIHPGNESYIYSKYTFSMMTQYEFISDQYAGLNIEHSLGGGIFNYIPLVKKLKFRQFWTAKGLIGSLSKENIDLNFNKGYTFRNLNGSPYLEVGTGIENILRVFRIDFIWRLAPEKLPTEANSKYFTIMGSAKLSF